MQSFHWKLLQKVVNTIIYSLLVKESKVINIIFIAYTNLYKVRWIYRNQVNHSNVGSIPLGNQAGRKIIYSVNLRDFRKNCAYSFRLWQHMQRFRWKLLEKVVNTIIYSLLVKESKVINIIFIAYTNLYKVRWIYRNQVNHSNVRSIQTKSDE